MRHAICKHVVCRIIKLMNLETTEKLKSCILCLRSQFASLIDILPLKEGFPHHGQLAI